MQGCRPAYLTGFSVQSKHNAGTRDDRRFGASLGRLFHLDRDKSLVVERCTRSTRSSRPEPWHPEIFTSRQQMAEAGLCTFT